MTTIIDRKPRITYNDIITAYLTSGLASVSTLLVSHTNPIESLNRAIDTIKEHDAERDLGDLEDIRDRFVHAKAKSTRGAKSIVELGSKVYKAQQVKDDIFIRLPVSAFKNIKKGDKVRVSYNEEQRQFIVEAV